MKPDKIDDIGILQLFTNNVWVETKSKLEYLQIIKSIQEAGLLGENIVIGNFFPDNIRVEDIEDVYDSREKYSKNPIVGISITHEKEHHVREYPKCFAKGNIMVSLLTKEDVKSGDKPDIKLKIKDFI